jgi:hypothetical protein
MGEEDKIRWNSRSKYFDITEFDYVNGDDFYNRRFCIVNGKFRFQSISFRNTGDGYIGMYVGVNDNGNGFEKFLGPVTIIV